MLKILNVAYFLCEQWLWLLLADHLVRIQMKILRTLKTKKTVFEDLTVNVVFVLHRTLWHILCHVQLNLDLEIFVYALRYGSILLWNTERQILSAMEEITEESFPDKKMTAQFKDPEAAKPCVLNKITFWEVRQTVIFDGSHKYEFDWKKSIWVDLCTAWHVISWKTFVTTA